MNIAAGTEVLTYQSMNPVLQEKGDGGTLQVENLDGVLPHF